jgi:uncharacterized membrane protein YeaQ/YmgE (transglycosylase-associated protein family)
MGIIAWIVLGFFAGLVARAIMPGKDRAGFIVTTVLGILGALLGGWLSTLLGGAGLSHGFGVRSLVLAVLGALVVLFAYHKLFRKPTA